MDQDEETNQCHETGDGEGQPQSQFTREGWVKDAHGASDQVLHRALALSKKKYKKRNGGFKIRKPAEGADLVPLKIRIAQIHHTKQETNPDEQPDLQGNPYVFTKVDCPEIYHEKTPREEQTHGAHTIKKT